MATQEAGHELRPQLLENWHHPYYHRLFETAGFAKAMDLLKWQILASHHHRVLPVIYELAERLEPDHGITVRNMRKRDFPNEIRAFMEVYNSAWERNWGFIPLTEAELESFGSELKPIIREKWGLIAEADGEVVGAALSLDDYNQVLAGMSGRLLPFGWLRLLREPQDRRDPRVRARREAGVPAHGNRRRVLRERLGDMPREQGPARRDRMDPRDQRADEPGDGGARGRRGQALSRIRARDRRLTRRHQLAICRRRSSAADAPATGQNPLSPRP